MNRYRFVITLAMLSILAIGSMAFAGTMSVAWDPVPDTDVQGYKIYYGTAPGSYTQVEDVGNVTSATLVGLDACTRYYVSVKAYDTGGLESPAFSNEINGLPRPVVSTVNPSSAAQGASLTLRVAGESYVDGATVEFSGSGITVNSTTWVSCTEIDVAVTIASSAPSGARDVIVTNPDRSYGQGNGLFTVSANAAPTVTGSSPAAGATAVAINVNPTVTFSEPMDPATITANNVRLLDSTGSPVAQAAGSPTLSPDGLTATINPAADLANEADYRSWVRGGASGVKDTDGMAMASDWQHGTPFTTADAPDTDPPGVASTSPADGATGVAIDIQPSVTFDEEVDPATISASTVQLIDPTGAVVAQAAGWPTLSPNGLTVTIRPAASLDERKTYRIRVIGGAGGVKDLAGNAMASTWTQPTGFTTENLPPATVQNTRRTDVR